MDVVNIYKKLSDETFSLLKTHDYVGYARNSDYLIELFKHTVTKVNNLSNSKIIKSFDDILEALLDNMYKDKYYKETIELTNKYLEVIEEIDNQKKYNIYYPSAIEKQIRLIAKNEIIEEIQEIENLVYQINRIQRIRANDIVYYNQLYYISLHKNREISAEDKVNLKRKFLRWLISNINYNNDKSLKTSSLKTIYAYIRNFTLNDELGDFNLLLDQVYTANKLSQNRNSDKIFTVVFFYIYYISIKEKDVDARTKENASLLFKNELKIENLKVIEVIREFKISDIWSFYLELKKEFSDFNWEIMKENEVKSLQMDAYFKEYFLFLNLILQQNIYITDKRIFKPLELEEIRGLVKYFDNKGFLLASFYDNFKDFLNLIMDEAVEKEKVFEQIKVNNAFGSLLINTYKDRVLTNLREFKKNEKVLENIQNDIANIDKEFGKWAFKDFYKDAINEDSNKLVVKNILKVKIDVENYGENVILVGRNLADTIVGIYENYLMGKLQIYTEKINLKFRDTDKISRILRNIEELNKKYALAVNSKITSTNFEQKFFAFEDRGSIDNYNFKMNKILMQQREFKQFEGQFYLDGNLLELFNFILNVGLRELEEVEIEEELDEFKSEGDIYQIPTYNGKINLILNKDEAVEYVKNKNYMLDIILSGEINLLSDRIGSVVQLDN
ncbi:hypothetical protein [Bacillus tropicus]|uniref:hypothetical protein n=2 Tax=Bacillus tropicus TaxID=2026188 RepID=UPI0023B17484|nr:hypothetical protein [Bacillus tropicus]MDE7573796.1 hypothetical protein [Bacillus tropicus]